MRGRPLPGAKHKRHVEPIWVLLGEVKDSDCTPSLQSHIIWSLRDELIERINFIRLQKMEEYKTERTKKLSYFDSSSEIILS